MCITTLDGHEVASAGCGGLAETIDVCGVLVVLALQDVLQRLGLQVALSNCCTVRLLPIFDCTTFSSGWTFHWNLIASGKALTRRLK